MSKEQVSGSLTLSLGGLADEVAGEVVNRLRGLIQPQVQVFDHHELMRILASGLGLTYEEAGAITRTLAQHGLMVVQIPEGTIQESPQAEPESAAAWFEREVNGR